MRLFARVVYFRQCFRDHKLRHIDFVLQEIRNDLFCIAGAAETLEGAQGVRVGGKAYAWAPSTFLSINILCKHVSITAETSRQLSRRTVYQRRTFRVVPLRIHCPPTSIPFESILSYFSGCVQYRPAYLFLLISKYGK